MSNRCATDGDACAEDNAVLSSPSQKLEMVAKEDTADDRINDTHKYAGLMSNKQYKRKREVGRRVVVCADGVCRRARLSLAGALSAAGSRSIARAGHHDERG